MPKKAKIRSINISRKWKHRHIKTESNTYILLPYREIFSHIIKLSLCQSSHVFQEYPELNLSFFSIYQVLSQTTPRRDLQKTTHCQHQIPYNHIRPTKALWTYRNHLTLTFIFHFINTFAPPPHANTWHRRGGPITQTIDHFGLNTNHRRYAERTRKKKRLVLQIRGVKYAGINVTKNHGRPYLLSSSYEINLLSQIQRKTVLALSIQRSFINCHFHTHGENAASRSTVNLDFRRLEPKITKNQKIQQGTKN